MSSSLSLSFKKGPRFTSTSSRNLPINIISSGIQKYIRRSEKEKALNLLIEWLGFVLFEDSQSKPILTNLKNRIIEIIPFEDVLGFAQPWLIKTIKELKEKWEEEKRSLKAGRYMYLAVELLCLSRKCRIGSDIRAQFGSTSFLSSPMLFVSNEKGIFEKMENWLKVQKEAYEQLKKDFHNLNFSLEEKKEKCFTNLFILIQPCEFKFISSSKKIEKEWKEKCQKVRKQVRDLTNLLWEEILLPCYYSPLQKEILEYLKVLYSSNKTRKERFLYVIHALLIQFHKSTVELKCPLPITEFPVLLCEKEWMEKVEEHYSKPPLKVDDYVIDMHTTLGKRSLKKGRKEFAHEGSKVMNEDKEYFVQEWRDTYIQLKEKQDEEEEEKEEQKTSKRRKIVVKEEKEKTSNNNNISSSSLSFDLKEISLEELERIKKLNYVGQKVTSKWKQMVYLTPEAVYKGPYLLEKGNTKNRLELTYSRYLSFLSLEINVPKCEFLYEEKSEQKVIWMKMEQISSCPLEEWKKESKEPIEMCNGMKGSIIKRRSLGFDNGSNITLEEWEAYPEAAIELILILFVRYILEPCIGDTGFWNTLYRFQDHRVFMIDYEEVRDLTKKKYLESCGDPKKWDTLLLCRPLEASMKEGFEKLVGLGNYLSKNGKLREKWMEIKTKMEEEGKISYSKERVTRVDHLLSRTARM